MKKIALLFKSIILVMCFGLVDSIVVGQTQITNSDFEEWDNLGNDTERPVNWNNMKNGDLCALCSIGSKQTTWRDTDIRPGSSGSYSSKIVSSSALGNVINGNMTLGKLHAPSTTPTAGYNQTHRNESQFNQPFTGMPDSLVFWAKYSITNSNDNARVSFTIHGDYDYRDPEDANSSPYVVARVVSNFQTEGEWRRMSFPFEYVGPSTTPAYILATFASSAVAGSGVSGATLWIDDLELIYNPEVEDPTVEITPNEPQYLVENQLGIELSVLESDVATFREWKWTTTSGSDYQSFDLPEFGETFIPQFENEGVYYVVCESNFDGVVVISEEVQVNVMPFLAVISPEEIQNLLIDEQGNELTATETPDAESREWKYSTTQGEGYISFDTQETELTYTPQFADAGTYYIIVESTIGNVTVFSNEVQINVEEPIENEVNISPDDTQNLVETQIGTPIEAIEIPADADAREWKYSTTQDGVYQSFSPAETETTYIPLFDVAGTYYVVCEADFDGEIKTSNEVIIVVSEFSVIITPDEIQSLIENEAGTELTATEMPIAESREWKYSTTSGVGYVSFDSQETALTYTPQFANAGTYFVIVESTIGNVTVSSNEVQINVEEPVENVINISPITTQNLVETQIGTPITAIEAPFDADAREWKYTTTQGGDYQSFSPAETETVFTPKFDIAGTYFVVCEADFGGEIITSNEVTIVVSEFSVIITPDELQNLIEDEAGTELTATETPIAESREWKFSTTQGEGYVSFVTPETELTYTPHFADAGTYYVIVESTIGNVTVSSNEVQINVEEEEVSAETIVIASTEEQHLVENQIGEELIATESATSDARMWKYSSTSGSDYVEFDIPETGLTYTPQFAEAGTYYVVCEADFGGEIITSNEVTIVVSEFSVIITPDESQDLIENEAGTELTATEMPVAESREWKFSTTQGEGYVSFVTPETELTYTPQFADAGTYYVIVESTIGNVTVSSNEVQINVEEEEVSAETIVIAPTEEQHLVENQVGEELTATESTSSDARMWKYSSTSGSDYVEFDIPETGLTYTPQFAEAGTYYVVCEADFGGEIITSNEVTIVVDEFNVTIEPAETQSLAPDEMGEELSVVSSVSPESVEWKVSSVSGADYQSFSPAETNDSYIPLFTNEGTYYIVCEASIGNVTVQSNEVLVTVLSAGIDNEVMSQVTIYGSTKDVIVDLTKVNTTQAQFNFYNMEGKLIQSSSLKGLQKNNVSVKVPRGIYMYTLMIENHLIKGKIYLN